MKPNQIILIINTIIVLTLFGCQPKTGETADIIYYNGTIITMNDSQKEVNSIAIKDGKIIAIGDWKTLKQKHSSDSTELKDLAGQTMLPGFIDGHSHFTLGMKMLAQANLNSPPVDSIRSISDLISRLKQHKERFGIKAGGWIVGWGYDPDQLEEKRHPNRKELTTAFPENPVFILHASFHMAVANSSALAIAGINAQTPNPVGGVIVKEENSDEPNGLLQETAMYELFGYLPTPTMEQSMYLLNATQELYASHGITTAQDGFTDSLTYAMLKAAAAQNALKIDIEALASFREAKYFIENETFGENNNGLRLAGMKVVSDGSPQGKTAYFREPYKTVVPNCTHECRGFPTVQPKQLEKLMASCYQNNVQLYVHANGDASIDMLLNTHEKVTDSLKMPNDKQRTVVIHSQFVQQDQLERYSKYDFVPSFFTNHAYFWGDVHLENLGEERANFLSPMKTTMDMGIICTNHTDYTITPIDQLFLLWTSVQRTSRTNQIIGKSERLTPYEGLKAITINGAYQHQNDDLKGSIEVGKLADLVILDGNPLTVEPDAIKDLKVLETIKKGEVIYSRKR